MLLFDQRLLNVWRLLGVAPVLSTRGRDGFAVLSFSRALHLAGITFYASLMVLYVYAATVTPAAESVFYSSNTQKAVTTADFLLILLTSLLCVLRSGSVWKDLLQVSGFLAALAPTATRPPGTPIIVSHLLAQVVLGLVGGGVWAAGGGGFWPWLGYAAFQLPSSGIALLQAQVLGSFASAFAAINASLPSSSSSSTFSLGGASAALVKLGSDHRKLVRGVERISLSLGSHALISLGYLWLRVVAHLYRTVGSLFLPSTWQTLPYVLNNLSLAVLLLFRLWFLLWAASSTKRQAWKTRYVVFKLINKGVPAPLVRQMRKFEEDIKRNDFSISAAGYFTLEANLFLSVCSSITSYVTILLTFQSKSNKTDEF